jgi:hypothetical protein
MNQVECLLTPGAGPPTPRTGPPNPAPIGGTGGIPLPAGYE